MARRSMLAAAKGLKSKGAKASKVAQQIADTRHMGDEPEVAGKTRDTINIGRIFNWYNYMCGRSDARDYIEALLKSKNRIDDLRTLKRVPDVWINLQAGWLARIILRGGVGFESSFEARLAETLARAGIEPEVLLLEEKTVEKPRTTIQERIADKTSDVIGELEELIDQQGWTIDVYEWLTKKQVTPLTARKIRDFFKPIVDEASELISKNADQQLVEGYAYLSKTMQKQRSAFYSKLITDCERFADVAKKQKTPRKKKPVSVEKKLKNFKYQQDSKEYKLASIKPEKIIGASELWTFNTKYRTLSVFYTNHNNGLDIKGTTVINYDPDTSKTFRIGRKTEQHVATVLKGARRAINKMIEELNGKTGAIQHRINENTILLKAD